MAYVIHSRRVATITELKRNPMGTVEAGQGEVITIMNRNQPVFYCVPVKVYEDLMRRVEVAETEVLKLPKLAQK
ncbi:type II toxin-antitoxin system prevent-host-death family antitoxin [Xenorhabdus sp. SGI246]|uniref:type II toxin-antitoxin system prevent-host-death family antitoxin n=1 Tax=Xenorhabdus sp. SGI246 TaxID=3158263 RepID=UPI00349FA528